MKIKVLLSLISISLFTCSVFPQTEFVNRVKNGNFDIYDYSNPEFYWVSPNFPGGVLVEGNHTPTYLQYCINPPSVRFSGGEGYYMEQEIEVESNKSYKFEFIGRIHNSISVNGNVPNDKGYTLEALILNNETELCKLIVNTNTNTDYSTEFTVPDGVNKVKVKFFKPQKGVAFIDDVKVYNEEEIVTPEPPVEETVGLPSMKLQHETKELVLGGIHNETTITVTTPDGETVTFEAGTSDTFTFNFEGKSLGKYVFELTGKQEKTFVINTNALNTDE